MMTRQFQLDETKVQKQIHQLQQQVKKERKEIGVQ